MILFLVKRFVKDYEHTESASVRTAYSLLASIVGIVCNVTLFVVKLSAGLMLRSISVMADAFNNLSDAASSVIGFIGMRMAAKPADEDHPFGHGRIEYIAAFIVAFFVVQVGFSLFKSSVGKIFHPEELSFHLILLIFLALSVAVKLWMAYFNRTMGKRINSSVLAATSADSLGDALATSATILSVVVYGIWHVNIDGIVGVIVSILVMIAGINIAKDTLAPLIGEAIDPKVYDEITGFVEGYDGIVGSHDLIVHNYGPSRSMASIHAEVPCDVDIEVSHEIIDTIEREAHKKLGIFLVIHMDPVETKNKTVIELKTMTEAVLKSLDDRLTLHDFRIVEGRERTNVIFDLVVPRDYTKTMQESLREEVAKRVHEENPKCYCVITVEYSYVMENQ